MALSINKVVEYRSRPTFHSDLLNTPIALNYKKAKLYSKEKLYRKVNPSIFSQTSKMVPSSKKCSSNIQNNKRLIDATFQSGIFI